MPPEGTRGKIRQWKTGFHYIALGPVFTPTGDVERDMAEIKRFYAPFKGKRAGHFEAD